MALSKSLLIVLLVVGLTCYVVLGCNSGSSSSGASSSDDDNRSGERSSGSKKHGSGHDSNRKGGDHDGNRGNKDHDSGRKKHGGEHDGRNKQQEHDGGQQQGGHHNRNKTRGHDRDNAATGPKTYACNDPKVGYCSCVASPSDCPYKVKTEKTDMETCNYFCGDKSQQCFLAGVPGLCQCIDASESCSLNSAQHPTPGACTEACTVAA